MAGGKGGRPRKAPELKLVTGTFRPDRDGKEADVPLGPMVAPAHLSEDACRYFAAIVALLEERKRASPHYTEHVAMLALRLEQVRRFNAVLETEGDTYETFTAAGGKMIRAHPAVAMLSDALRHAQSLLADLMLNPSAALKIAQGKKPEDNPFGDF